MVIMNKIQIEDINSFKNSFNLSSLLFGSKFLITGGTGLIGSTLVYCLLSLDKNIEITCPVRSVSKARAMYGKVFDKVHFIECDLLEYLGNYPENERFDFVVHCASPTSGKFMSEYPVETYLMAIESTRLILEHAKKYSESVVYISSIEYYGQN